MTVSSLIVPFIALIIITVMVDKFTLVLQYIMKRIPHLPDEFEKPIAYIIVFCVGFVVCWRGHYSLFTYLDFSFENDYEGWILTALVVSGGSAFLKESFSAMDSLPGILSGMYSYISRTVSVGKTTTSTPVETLATDAEETEMKEGQENLV